MSQVGLNTLGEAGTDHGGKVRGAFNSRKGCSLSEPHRKIGAGAVIARSFYDPNQRGWLWSPMQPPSSDCGTSTHEGYNVT